MPTPDADTTPGKDVAALLDDVAGTSLDKATDATYSDPAQSRLSWPCGSVH